MLQHLRLLLLAACIAATPTFANLGPLESVVSLGRDGSWTGAKAGDTYWLENRDDPGAIRYYYGPLDAAIVGNRDVSVTIALDTEDPEARAGLLYGFDADSRSYFLVVIGNDGAVDLYRRDRSGFSRMMSSELPGSRGPARRLLVRERGTEITVFLDGERVGTVSSAGTGRGAVGIVAMGMGRFGFSAYAVQAGTASVASPSPTGAATPTGSRDWVAHTLNDEFGFEQPMPAYRVSIPGDWSIKGAVQWYGEGGCPLDASKVHFMATAPDGSQRIEFIPGGGWSWLSLYDAMPQMQPNQYDGCAVRRITDMDTFVRAYIPSIRPDARILRSAPRPDLARRVIESAGSNFNSTPGQRADIQVAEVEIRYAVDDKTVNEVILPTVLFMSMAGPDPYGGSSGVTWVAQALGTLTTASVGKAVDTETMHRVAESLAMLPAYEARLNRYYQRKSELMASAMQRRRAAQQQYLAQRRAAAAATRATSSSIAQTNSDVLDIQFEGWKNRDKITSAGQSRSVDGILERRAYSNGSGQIVYMPQEYQRAYQLPNDVYVGTNDSFFNPVQATGEFGAEMQPYDYRQ